MSLPPRGAWIEIFNSGDLIPIYCESLPPRGAWIEIDIYLERKLVKNGRSPHGERGLKYLQNILLLLSRLVAPPTGSGY